MITKEDLENGLFNPKEFNDHQLTSLVNLINSFDGLTIKQVDSMLNFINNGSKTFIRDKTICVTSFVTEHSISRINDKN